MTIKDLEPYFSAVSAVLSITTLGFMLSLLQAIRSIAKDRISLQEDRVTLEQQRVTLVKDELERSEKWADRQRAELNAELASLKSQLDELLSDQGINLSTLVLGKQLSESATTIRSVAAALVDEMQSNLKKLRAVDGKTGNEENGQLELTVAMGAMAAGSFGDAAAHFDYYSKEENSSWDAHFARGVAHANAREGEASNIAALRAYNEAIALAPQDLDPTLRARLFDYRGAILKRLGRLEEAKSDLVIALRIADDMHEINDIHYNLSCVYAMQDDYDSMMIHINALNGERRFLNAIRGHSDDYFELFQNDPAFVAATR